MLLNMWKEWNALVVDIYIYERSSSTKFKLHESTKRNAWLSLRDDHLGGSQQWECDVVWHSQYFLLSCTPHLITSEAMVYHDRTR